MKGLLAVIAETFRESFGIQVETICYSGIDEMITAIFNGEIDLFGPLNESFEAVRDHELLEYHGTATCGADLLIQNASKIICRIYANSPVFRIGGDEFIIVLTGADYGRRDERLSELRGKNQTITEVQQIKKGLVSLASGMAVYDKEMDHTVADVFTRADEAMYACKKQMKLYTVGSHHECDVIYGGWCKQHRKRRCGHNHCVFVDHCGKSLLISLK